MPGSNTITMTVNDGGGDDDDGSNGGVVTALKGLRQLYTYFQLVSSLHLLQTVVNEQWVLNNQSEKYILKSIF